MMKTHLQTTSCDSVTVFSTVKQMQGRRTTQEDRYVLIDDLHQYIKDLQLDVLNNREPVIPDYVTPACLYALFDGHMGSLASAFCAKTMPIEIIKQLARLPSIFHTNEAANGADRNTNETSAAVTSDNSTKDLNEPVIKRRKLSDSREELIPLSEPDSQLIEGNGKQSLSVDSGKTPSPVFPLEIRSSDTGTSQITPGSLNTHAVASALRNAFISIDKQFLLKHRLNKDGTTVVITLILGTSMFTAWVGDSRSILGSTRRLNFSTPLDPNQVFCEGATIPGVMNSRRWSSSELSSDHKPSRPDEQERIQASGGIVITISGIARVARADFEEECRKLKQAHSSMGATNRRPPVALAVSRSIGDREFKQPSGPPLISSVPEIRHTILQTDSDRVVVMGCDGIFDVMSDQDVVDLIQSLDDVTCKPESIGKGASELVKTAFQRGSEDNLTVIVVRFG